MKTKGQILGEKLRQAHQRARKPDFSASGEPSAISAPIQWRQWWLARHAGKTWADADAAWRLAVE